MKDVSGGRSADESRPLSCTRRPGPGIRRTLAGTFLAAIMLGWPVVMAGGRAAGVPILTANQSSERITAAPGAPTGLTAKTGDAQVILSWAAPASDGGASIIGYPIYEGTSPDGESSTPVPGSDITGCTSTATTGSCTLTPLVNAPPHSFTVTPVTHSNAYPPLSTQPA